MASESPTNDALLPTLPTEMVEEVIDQASDDPASLRQLSLLCKSLLTRARIHLFKSIVIRDVEQMDSSRQFLDSHPWVLPLVRKVVLSISIPFKYSKANVPLLDIVRLHLFTRLPNLRGWKMKTNLNSSWNRNRGPPRLSLHSSTTLCYRIYGGRVQNLELVKIYFRDMSHFIRLVSAFTSLCGLTCSEIRILSLHTGNSENSNKPVKLMKIQQLSIGKLVDIHCIKYLLTSTTLESLNFEFSNLGSNAVIIHAYNTQFEDSTGRLSKLSSLRLTISLAESSHGTIIPTSLGLLQAEEQIQWTTRTLLYFWRLRARLDVQMQFKSDTIALLGNYFSPGPRSSVLEACTALEKVLLTFPVANVQFCSPEPNQRRAGRAKFWSPAIVSAFPNMNERGRLAFPWTHSSDPLGHEDKVTCLVASPDSKWIASAARDQTIIFWDAECGTVVQEWRAGWDTVEHLCFSPDGRRLVSSTGRSDGTVDSHAPAVWDISITNVTRLAVLVSTGKTTKVKASAWSPDGTLISLAYSDGTVRVWDAVTFQQRGLLKLPLADGLVTPNWPGSLQWSLDSHYLVCAYTSKHRTGLQKWTVWSPLTEEPQRRFPSHPTRFEVWSFDHEGRRIATAVPVDGPGLDPKGEFEGPDKSSDGRSGLYYVQIWDVMSGTPLVALGYTEGVLRKVSFSADGRSLLSVSKDGLIKVWDAQTGHEIASLDGDGEGFPAMACLSPDGKYIARYDRGKVQLWNVGTASFTAVFTEHKSTISKLAFSPDGEFLASGDWSGIVHIRRLSDFIGH